MKTPINVTQLCKDEPHRQRLWEETRRHPGAYYKNRFQWFHYPRWRYVAPFPLHVDFEVSSKCNLECPMCFRRHFNNDHRFQHMDFELFCRGIDECASQGLYSIRLSWRGESTLNPDLIEMVYYAKKAGIKEVSFLTNGSALSDSFSKDLINAGLDYLTISVDGLEKKYNHIRKPLLFSRTVDNIRNLYQIKEKEGGGFPKVKIQGIYSCFKENPELYFQTFAPISDLVSFNLEHDYSLIGDDCIEKLCCPFLWQRLTITATGQVPLCISDWDLDIILGDLNFASITDLWNCTAMNQARNLHKTGDRRELRPCRKCIRLTEATLE